jgi:hypothetical protein
MAHHSLVVTSCLVAELMSNPTGKGQVTTAVTFGCPESTIFAPAPVQYRPSYINARSVA